MAGHIVRLSSVAFSDVVEWSIDLLKKYYATSIDGAPDYSITHCSRPVR